MARSIDWTRLGWCMTQNVKVGSHSTSVFANGKSRFAVFKAASDQVMGKHSAAASRPTAINWDHYKNALPAQKEWVESMESKFNATKVPAPTDAGLTAAVNAEDADYSAFKILVRFLPYFQLLFPLFLNVFFMKTWPTPPAPLLTLPAPPLKWTTTNS